MEREGLGAVPPRPVEIYLPPAVIREMQQEALRRESARCYAGRSDLWGQGLIEHPTLRGLVGEWALIVGFINPRLGLSLTVDMKDRPAGDGGCDVRVFRKIHQVKTRRRRGDVLIRRQTEGGRIVPIHWDNCISATWTPEVEGLENLITLDGWLARKWVLGSSEFKDARKGRHKNLEIADSKLQSMESLIEYLEVIRDYKDLP